MRLAPSPLGRSWSRGGPTPGTVLVAGERLKRAALPVLLTFSVVSAILSGAVALVEASPLPLLEVPLAALLGAWAYTGIRPEAGRKRLPLPAAFVLTMVSFGCVGVQAGGTARWPGAAVGALLGFILWLPESLRRWQTRPRPG